MVMGNWQCGYLKTHREKQWICGRLWYSFCIWLPLLNIITMRSSHVVCNSILVFVVVVAFNISFYDWTTINWLFYCWWMFGLFIVWSLWIKLVLTLLCIHLYGTKVLISMLPGKKNCWVVLMFNFNKHCQ